MEKWMKIIWATALVLCLVTMLFLLPIFSNITIVNNWIRYLMPIPAFAAVAGVVHSILVLRFVYRRSRWAVMYEDPKGNLCVGSFSDVPGLQIVKRSNPYMTPKWRWNYTEGYINAYYSHAPSSIENVPVGVFDLWTLAGKQRFFEYAQESARKRQHLTAV